MPLKNNAKNLHRFVVEYRPYPPGVPITRSEAQRRVFIAMSKAWPEADIQVKSYGRHVAGHNAATKRFMQERAKTADRAFEQSMQNGEDIVDVLQAAAMRRGGAPASHRMLAAAAYDIARLREQVSALRSERAEWDRALEFTADECPTCEGAGWVESSYQAAGAPNFVECPFCSNPEGKLGP